MSTILTAHDLIYLARQQQIHRAYQQALNKSRSPKQRRAYLDDRKQKLKERNEKR